MKPISLSDFDYHLPESRIAEFPLEKRDEAKMLVWNKGQIVHSTFKHLPDFLPERSIIIFNETKVVRARLIFHRESGAAIEVFCIEPIEPYSEVSQAMRVKGSATWKCMVGNLKKWKSGEKITLSFEGGETEAILLSKSGRFADVRLNWTPQLTIAEMMERAGKVPLPPYIHREPSNTDSESYQTIYARAEGAVAAPTAGLHFTSELLKNLGVKGFSIEKLILHVGSGTFQPVEHENVLEHPMHNEEISFSRNTVSALAERFDPVVCVGTTSLRAIESLYWFGASLLKGEEPDSFFISKLLPYDLADYDYDRIRSFRAVLVWMKNKNLQSLTGRTEIFIFPGYKFRVAEGLITNFHLPKSTLLMLISAFTKGDWKRIYDEALKNDYRFLSFGDSSLFLR